MSGSINLITPRLGLQQRVLPAYRIPFFDTLASVCSKGLCIFAGSPRSGEIIGLQALPKVASVVQARNHHLFCGILYLCWQSGLIEWLVDWQPEALIVEANPRYLHTPVAVRWMHARRRPVLGWGLGVPKVRRGLSNPFRRHFISQFDAIITYSQQGADEYQSAGFPPERIFIAPNAVTSRPTKPLPNRPNCFTDERATILFVGRLQRRKRVDFLLRACAALPVSMQPRLWIVGDGPMRSELEAHAQQIYSSAHFYGALYGEELSPFFKGADLFVLPGTGGLAIQEAMSYGLPVIVAEADGTQSNLVRPENGWCILPGDIETLTAILLEAFRDIPRLRQMGRASYKITAEEANIENMVRVFELAIHTIW